MWFWAFWWFCSDFLLLWAVLLVTTGLYLWVIPEFGLSAAARTTRRIVRFTCWLAFLLLLCGFICRGVGWIGWQLKLLGPF